MPKVSRGTNHFGSRLHFMKDSTLLVTLGDRIPDEAQSQASHLGTIVRLNDDGSILNDNPFVDVAGALPEIHSYGHRNVQGIALHPGGTAIWSHEHGPRGCDELNVVTKGANHGWPKVTYGIAYSGAVISDKTSAPGVTAPLLHWVPSIAPSGMAFYTGNKIPAWQGDLGERIRDVRSGPDGYLYILTDGPDASLLRLEPKQ